MFVAPSVVKITKIAALSSAKIAVTPTINTVADANLSNSASARAITESLFLLLGNRCRLCEVRGHGGVGQSSFFFLKDLLHTISNTEERRLKKEMIRIDNQGQ